jgi:hypothetical protein
MNSYNLGAMSGTYTTGYNTKPRKAKDDTENTTGTNSPKLDNLGKEFKNENFNGWGVAGLTGTGFLIGGASDTLGILGETIKHMDIDNTLTKEAASQKALEKGYGKWSAIYTGVALAGGLLWEKMRSDGAKKHNTELLAKLRTEENGKTV